MENLENKIIQEKINSLDSLPEGYQTSLAGKWELIEASLEGRKNKRPLWYWSSAAVILMVAGVFWLNIKSEQPLNAVQQVKQIKNKPVVAKTEKQLTEMVIEKKEKKRSKHKGVNKKPVVTPVADDKILIVAVSTDSVIPVADIQEKPLVAKVQKTKPALQVVDFTDSIKPQEWVAVTNSAKPKFRFTIGSLAKSAKNKNSFDSPLKLHTNF
ncbi:MAG: hypothetical protein K1X81_05730 [Bacteroidia bacterium]|nr:hypothetical protein [Bacteroidia bacterium]